MAILIPVEVRARELEAKIYLAELFAQKGMPTLLGRVDVLNELVPYLPSSVYLAKTFFGNIFQEYREYRRAGHKIVGLDEEAGIRFSDPTRFFERRINAEVLPYVDKFFTWNNTQKEVFVDMFPEMEGSVHATGSPRIDLLSISSRAAINERSSNNFTILVSSNFVTKGLTAELNSLKKATVRAYRDAIIKLTKEFDGLEILVRPHPNEERNNWVTLESRSNRIRVISNKSSLRLDLLDADLVLHCGCTASIEANIKGIPSLYYDPENWLAASSVHGVDITNAIGSYVNSYEELAGHVSTLLNGSGEGADQFPSVHLLKLGYNLNGNCSDMIVDLVSSYDEAARAISEGDLRNAALRAAVGRPWSFVKAWSRNLAIAKITKGAKHAEQKCPEIVPGDITKIYDEFFASRRQIKHISRNLFFVPGQTDSYL